MHVWPTRTDTNYGPFLLSGLPDDIWLIVFGLLDFRSIRRCESVSRELREIVGRLGKLLPKEQVDQIVLRKRSATIGSGRCQLADASPWSHCLRAVSCSGAFRLQNVHLSNSLLDDLTAPLLNLQPHSIHFDGCSFDAVSSRALHTFLSTYRRSVRVLRVTQLPSRAARLFSDEVLRAVGSLEVLELVPSLTICPIIVPLTDDYLASLVLRQREMVSEARLRNCCISTSGVWNFVYMWLCKSAGTQTLSLTVIDCPHVSAKRLVGLLKVYGVRFEMVESYASWKARILIRQADATIKLDISNVFDV